MTNQFLLYLLLAQVIVVPRPPAEALLRPQDNLEANLASFWPRTELIGLEKLANGISCSRDSTPSVWPQHDKYFGKIAFETVLPIFTDQDSLFCGVSMIDGFGSQRDKFALGRILW